MRFPKSKKQVQRYIGFVNHYRNYIPRLSKELLGFFKLLKANKQSEYQRSYRQLQSDQHSTSRSTRIGSQTNNHRTTIRPNDGCQHGVSARSIKDVSLVQRIVSNLPCLLEHSYVLWETTLSTLVMTDKRLVTRFFETKAIPPILWNACDFVLQFNFHIMHVAETQN